MKSLDKNTKALIAIFLAVVFGGGLAVFSKIALQEVPPFSLNFVRFVLSLILLLPLFLRERPRFTKESIHIFLLSFISSINIILWVFGIRSTSASLGQMIHTSDPLLIMIFSYFILKEKFIKKKVIGIFIGLIGVCTIILSPLVDSALQFQGATLHGNVLVFGSALSFSIYSVVSKKYQKTHSPLYLTTIFACTTILISIPFLPHEFATNWWSNLSPRALFSICYIAFSGSLFYIFYQYAIKHSSPVVASVSLYLTPIATFLLAAVLLHEKLTGVFIIGSLITFLGAYLVTKNSKISYTIPTK